MGVGAVQTGHPDDTVQICGLGESDDNMFVVGPVLGGPMGAKIVVNDILNGERTVWILAGAIIGGVGQGDGFDSGGVQDTLGGDALRTAVVRCHRCSEGDSGGAALARPVAGNYIDVVGGAVGQSGDGQRCARDLLAGLPVGGGGGILDVGVVYLIVGGIFPALPGDLELSVQRGDVYHIGGVRPLRGLGGGLYLGTGLTLPAVVHRDDGEAVGFQVVQSGDLGLGYIDLEPAGQIFLTLGPVLHPIAGYVGQGAPGQADLAVAGGGGELLYLAVGLGQVLIHNVL